VKPGDSFFDYCNGTWPPDTILIRNNTFF